MEGDHQAPDYLAAPPGLARGPHPSEINAVPKYHGDSNNDEYDARQWLDMLQEHAQMWGWTEEVCIKVARIRMAGPARHWISSLNRSTPWRELVEKFLARFGERTEVALSRLAACKQEAGENVDSYADRFRRDCNLAGRAEDAALRHQFTAGLHRRIKLEVHRQIHSLQSLSEIIATAKEWEMFYEDDRKANDRNNAAYGPPPRRGDDYNRRNNQGPRQNGFEPHYSRNQQRGPQQYNGPPRSDGNQGGRPAYQGPRDYDNWNRNYQDPHRPPMNSRFYSTPPVPRPVPAAPSAEAASEDIDELARQLEQLQLNLAQLKREQRQGAGALHLDAINMFQPSCPPPARHQPLADHMEKLRHEFSGSTAEFERHREGQHQPFWITERAASMRPPQNFPSAAPAAVSNYFEKQQPQLSHWDIPSPCTPIPPPSHGLEFPTTKELTSSNKEQLVMDLVDDNDDPSAYWSIKESYAAERPGEEMEPTRRAPSKLCAAFDVNQDAAPAAAAAMPGSLYPGWVPPTQRVPSADQSAISGAPAARQRGPQALGPRALQALRPPPPLQRRSYNTDPTNRANPVPLLKADAQMCVAGVLLNDPQLVEKGKDTARMSDNHLKHLQVQSPTGGPAASAAHATNLYQQSHPIAGQIFYKEAVLTNSNGAERDLKPKAIRLSTCEVPVCLGFPALGAMFEATPIFNTRNLGATPWGKQAREDEEMCSMNAADAGLQLERDYQPPDKTHNKIKGETTPAASSRSNQPSANWALAPKTGNTEVFTTLPNSRAERLAIPAEAPAAEQSYMTGPTVPTWEEAHATGSMTYREPEASSVMNQEQQVATAMGGGSLASPPASLAPTSTTLLCSEEVSVSEVEEESSV